MGQEPQESQYKVSDRRRFSAEGEPLELIQEDGADSSDESAPREPSAAGAEKTETATPKATHAPPALPQASFDLLVVSLGMQAQLELGEQGGADAAAPNLDLARHTIDLLAVLKEKTKGNLTMEESRLLENTLTELRFRYIQRVEEINQKAKS